MLHRDTAARLHKSGPWIFAEYRFVSGKIRGSRTWNAKQGLRLLDAQQEIPVELHRDESRRRSWWMYQDKFYWEDEGLTPEQVKALALEIMTRKDRRLERAASLMENRDALTRPSREPVPPDVKVLVWNRDGGRCVQCGSKQQLEFDHIIPVSLGGATTAENLQVLCAVCNGEKGAWMA